MTHASDNPPPIAAEVIRRDHAMEVALARLLTTMMIVAAAVMLLGVVLLLTRPQPLTPMGTFATFASPPREGADLRSLASIWAGVSRGQALAIMQAGLVLLIATPVLRVAATAAIFAKQRDWLYVGITLVVLVSLGVGLAGLVE